MKNAILTASFYISFVCAAIAFCSAPAIAKMEPEPVTAPDGKPADEKPLDEKPPEKPVRTSCGGGVEGDVVVKCGMG